MNNKWNLELEWNLELDKYYIGMCKLSPSYKKIIRDNPHCSEFFCTLDTCINKTECSKYLILNNIFKSNPFFKKHEKQLLDKEINDPKNTKKCEVNGYLYDFIPRTFNPNEKTYVDKYVYELDKYKTIENFYKQKFIYKLKYSPYVMEYGTTYPKPKSVIHWGQLKLFLTTLQFLITYIKSNDPLINIIYVGSAPGYNIEILADMFPNTRWYLIDPAVHYSKLYKHKQIIEIKTEFFTTNLANYYYNLFKNKSSKLYFISDIRLNPDDDSVIKDNDINIVWHKIIKPDYSFLKFRCPYNGEYYDYYKGDVYLQPYSNVSSTESRLVLKKKLEKEKYNINEYQGKFLYFNRIIRPAYHKQTIKQNKEFDHCYDCTFFSKIINEYFNKFNLFAKNAFSNQFSDITTSSDNELPDVLSTMYFIKNKLGETTKDRIKYTNIQIRHNIK
jgi:hypothetical protein